ncbi:hypothetical protein C8A01DRAFT_37783 [Parachaetomium inaequale]|uniref:Uncharacterized protein n=1 Tax=Parachaetomium inaequale TaxID=2588326 RepID=A0AAN6PFF8_9PEZI|nr:hypothetical protein C8A01DRAFT_37783 [Parachaetomium inaequale]
MTSTRPRGGLRISDLLNPPPPPPPSSSTPSTPSSPPLPALETPPPPHQTPPPPTTPQHHNTSSTCNNNNKKQDRRSARLTRAEKAEIRALRAWRNLTYSQIAALTSYTHRQVQYACTGPAVTLTPDTPGTHTPLPLPRKRRKKREMMGMMKGKREKGG